MAPNFLSLEEVLRVHVDQLSRYGGSAGLRDEGLLRSALAQPEASFGGEWLHADLAEMAAAYAFHLCQNHPFLDGNKRIAAASAVLFLALNDQALVANPTAFADIILHTADGRTTKADLASFFRAHLSPWPQ